MWTEKSVFDPVTHIYRPDGVDGHVVPSVTQILQMVGAMNYNANNLDYVSYGPADLGVTKYKAIDWEYYKDKGSKVHLALQYLDEGTLDLKTLDPELKGKVEAWLNFLKDSGFVSREIEKIYHNSTYGVCCTVDRVGHFSDGKSIILEIKPAAYETWHDLQTAGQVTCMDVGYTFLYDRMSVHLSDNGSYKVHEHKNTSDGGVFKAMITVANWKANQLGGWKNVLLFEYRLNLGMGNA